MLKIKPVTPGNLLDLATLFCTDEVAEGCWCMWFIIDAKDFNTAGAEGNKNIFSNLVDNSTLPVGFLANEDDKSIGWCAVGPRARHHAEVAGGRGYPVRGRVSEYNRVVNALPLVG